MNDLILKAKKNPGYGSNWIDVAYFYRISLHDGLRSIVYYDKAISLDSSNSVFWLGRGIAYLSLKQYNRALKDLDTVVSLRPNSSAGWSARADALKSLNHEAEAIRAYSNAIRLDPSNARDWAARGYLYQKMGFCNQANADLTEAAKLQKFYASPKCR